MAGLLWRFALVLGVLLLLNVCDVSGIVRVRSSHRSSSSSSSSVDTSVDKPLSSVGIVFKIDSTATGEKTKPQTKPTQRLAKPPAFVDNVETNLLQTNQHINMHDPTKPWMSIPNNRYELWFGMSDAEQDGTSVDLDNTYYVQAGYIYNKHVIGNTGVFKNQYFANNALSLNQKLQLLGYFIHTIRNYYITNGGCVYQRGDHRIRCTGQLISVYLAHPLSVSLIMSADPPFNVLNFFVDRRVHPD